MRSAPKAEVASGVRPDAQLPDSLLPSFRGMRSMNPEPRSGRFRALRCAAPLDA